MIEMLALIVFPAMMLFAAFSDLFTMTIPNRVSLFLIVAYFVFAALMPLPLWTVGLHVSAGLAVLALTFAMFQFGWVGGGDAKLASATALWIGWENLLEYGVLASIAGGVLTVIIIAMRWNELPKRLLDVAFIGRLADKSSGVPYGIALALAGLLIYPHTGVFTKLAGL